jgi:uncharacterized membrane protein
MFLNRPVTRLDLIAVAYAIDASNGRDPRMSVQTVDFIAKFVGWAALVVISLPGFLLVGLSPWSLAPAELIIAGGIFLCPLTIALHCRWRRIRGKRSEHPAAVATAAGETIRLEADEKWLVAYNAHFDKALFAATLSGIKRERIEPRVYRS